ncbi:hypothetical protein ACFO5R_14405 [Halosolutus amylolyticus]|uniref:Uncharacterized protein n=1 Tax=Halosolutus amylolyticus TaxID=2932267 RepID=A0ABD5PRL8_9EURY|nr:hypothetical protein [Halosolutus amylolyticus]
MHRRTALTTAGGTLAVALAGCLSDSDDTGTDDEDDVGDDDPGDDGQNGDGDGGEWNDDYLGERMATTPSLEFSTIQGAQLADVPLESEDVDDGTTDDRVETDPRVDEPPHEITVPDEADSETDPDGEYRVRLLETAAERDDVLEMETVDDETRDRLQAVDFDDAVLVVVESGYGSSSIVHRWARVEDVDDGVHLHGYYRKPYERLADMSPRLSVLEVERPDDDPSLARVSLTVTPDHRVHFNSTEGVVSIGD